VATPSPGRGIPYQFNGPAFRNAIRFVNEMAAPPLPADQLVFHFTAAVAFAGYSDGDQVPFNPAEAVTRTIPAPISVPCSVEFTPAADVPTAFGTVVPAKIKVLLLDEDYLLVADASYVVSDGDRYNRQFVPPSFGLFDVGLHEMTFVAENET
jgi:hypothetical protein